LTLFTDDSNSSYGNENKMCVIKEIIFGGNRENGILSDPSEIYSQ
jgi:hypothetical protein